MLDEAQTRSRQSALAVLALLVGMLLGPGAAASQVDLDGRTIRVAGSDQAKSALTPRASARSEADQSDPDDLLSGAAPGVVTQLVSVRFGGTAASASAAWAASAPALGYRARAPPAG